MRVVVKGYDEKAEGEQVTGRGEGVVDDEVRGREVKAVLDVGGEARVEGGWGRGRNGGDCKGKGGELPV